MLEEEQQTVAEDRLAGGLELLSSVLVRMVLLGRGVFAGGREQEQKREGEARSAEGKRSGAHGDSSEGTAENDRDAQASRDGRTEEVPR